jgi:DNA-directed RNA polymerase specialized sigma24 family protein
MAAPDRIAFVLHRIEGLDSREVAAVMGASSARTNVRLRRSLRQVFDGIVGDPVLSRFRTG